MTRFPNNVAWIFGLLFAAACSDNTEERREFEKLDAAIGTVASSDREDRGIRLDELNAAPLRFEPNEKLRKVCASAYQAFESAVRLLEKAKRETRDAERDVADAVRRKSNGEPLSDEEQERILKMGKQAQASVQSMNKTLDEAQKLVTACQEERNRLRLQLFRR